MNNLTKHSPSRHTGRLIDVQNLLDEVCSTLGDGLSFGTFEMIHPAEAESIGDDSQTADLVESLREAYHNSLEQLIPLLETVVEQHTHQHQAQLQQIDSLSRQVDQLQLKVTTDQSTEKTTANHLQVEALQKENKQLRSELHRARQVVTKLGRAYEAQVLRQRRNH